MLFKARFINDDLTKAREGSTKPGHKYISRKKTPAGYAYTYAEQKKQKHTTSNPALPIPTNPPPKQPSLFDQHNTLWKERHELEDKLRKRGLSSAKQQEYRNRILELKSQIEAIAEKSEKQRMRETSTEPRSTKIKTTSIDIRGPYHKSAIAEEVFRNHDVEYERSTNPDGSYSFKISGSVNEVQNALHFLTQSKVAFQQQEVLAAESHNAIEANIREGERVWIKPEYGGGVGRVVEIQGSNNDYVLVEQGGKRKIHHFSDLSAADKNPFRVTSKQRMSETSTGEPMTEDDRNVNRTTMVYKYDNLLMLNRAMNKLKGYGIKAVKGPAFSLHVPPHQEAATRKILRLNKSVPESTYEHADKPGAGAKKRKKLKHKGDKAHAVMGEYKRGTLRSGSGAKVRSRAQAIAIAMSEAGLSKSIEIALLLKGKKAAVGATADWGGKKYRKESEGVWKPIGGERPGGGGGYDAGQKHPGENIKTSSDLHKKFMDTLARMTDKGREVFRGGKFDVKNQQFVSSNGKYALKYDGGEVGVVMLKKSLKTILWFGKGHSYHKPVYKDEERIGHKYKSRKKRGKHYEYEYEDDSIKSSTPEQNFDTSPMLHASEPKLHNSKPKTLRKSEPDKETIRKWLSQHPNPEDEAIHALAESKGWNKHETEDMIYEIATSFLAAGRSKKTTKEPDAHQLAMGIKVEMEHTTDKEVAEKIARDHLAEFPDYYTRLDKMERVAKKSSMKKSQQTAGMSVFDAGNYHRDMYPHESKHRNEEHPEPPEGTPYHPAKVGDVPRLKKKVMPSTESSSEQEEPGHKSILTYTRGVFAWLSKARSHKNKE